MKKKVISSKNMAVRFPIYDGILLYLVLDKFHAAAWIWGSVGTIWAILFIAATVLTFQEESVDIFKDEKK
jgi:hypothetical protein